MVKHFSAFWKKYRSLVLFVFFGLIIQFGRTKLFVSLERDMNAENANTLSIGLSLIASFICHALFTWKYREGSLEEKAKRFAMSEVALGVIRTVVFPSIYFTILLSCQVISVGVGKAHAVNEIYLGGVFRPFITLLEGPSGCDVARTLVLDALAALCSFLLHNYWSFKERRYMNLSSTSVL